MTKLNRADLSTAIINEPYFFQLSAEDNGWDWYTDSYFIFGQSAGSMPNGMYVSSNGAISGTPTETGNFNFVVRAYSIDENYWSDDDITSDQESYTLYVTKKSTNPNCPAPNNEATIEIYLCLGKIEQDTLATGDEFELDINFFVDYEKGLDYAINTINFSIKYDPLLFAIDPERLTSLLLKEASTRVDSTVQYNNDTLGLLQITVTVPILSLDKSGRLMDLPLYTLKDIPANTYDFPITINEILSKKDDVSFPDEYEVDGSLVVNKGVE